MSGERYIPNPHIKDFIDFIRTPGEKDSYITQQEGRVVRIMGKLEELKAEKQELLERYPVLDTTDHDQFTLTPFDNLEGLTIEIPPEVHLKSWEIRRQENLIIANHPARLFAMEELEQRGFQAPPLIEDGVLEEFLNRKEIAWLSDLGQARQLSISEKDADHPQGHRTPFLSVGPLSFLGDRVRSFIGVGAMSDITGSVLAGVTLSKMHVLWHVSKDGKYADPKVQADFVKTVITELNNPDDPLLDGFTPERKKQIINRWISCMVVSTEADPDKALRRTEKTIEEGARSHRPYQHTAGIEVVKTTQALRKEYQDFIEIFASQISSEYIALACEEAGASGAIPGVGSGAMCITARMAALIPTNAHLPWSLRGKLTKMPLIGEGGAVNNPVISALVGMSGVLGSGSLGGGTFEAPGGMFFFSRDGGETFIKPYRGEASPAFKYLGGKTYPSGTPFFAEGVGEFREFDPFTPSITSKIRDAWEAVIVGAIDMGFDGDNPDIIGQMHRLDPSPIYKITQEGSKAQNTH